MFNEYSLSPIDWKFRLPGPNDYVKEFERLSEIVSNERPLGHEIVVVMGPGFVGAKIAGKIEMRPNLVLRDGLKYSTHAAPQRQSL